MKKSDFLKVWSLQVPAHFREELQADLSSLLQAAKDEGLELAARIAESDAYMMILDQASVRRGDEYLREVAESRVLARIEVAQKIRKAQSRKDVKP